MEKMEHLNRINLGWTTITEQLPSSFENVEGLETQGLECCSELDNLPGNIGNFKFKCMDAHGLAISQLPSISSGLLSLSASLLSGLSL